MQNKNFSEPDERITSLSHPVDVLTIRLHTCELSDLTDWATGLVNNRCQTGQTAGERRWRRERWES